MNQTQHLIEKMHSGDLDAIMEGISSNCDILILNAIMAGTKQKVKNAAFIDGIIAAAHSEAILLGVPLKSAARASLHLLGHRLYTGADPMILSMIETGFGI